MRKLTDVKIIQLIRRNVSEELDAEEHSKKHIQVKKWFFTC